MKVIIVTNIPNPYRIPLFNELNEMLLADGKELKVIFAAETYSRRKFVIDLNDCKFNFEFLGSDQMTFGNSERTTFKYEKLSDVFKKEQPDVIIVSGFSMATIKTWWYTRFNKAKFIIWSGSVSTKQKGLSLLRSLQRRLLAASASAFIVYGNRAGKYLSTLRVPQQKIFKAINTVDTSFFSEKTAELKEKGPKGSNKHNLCYVGYLSERKNVKQLLLCIRKLTDKRSDFKLDLIGDGDDKETLQQFAMELNLENIVHFVGFKQKSELPEYYAATDVFLFQTNFDIWGLVLNEAMAAGLPCIASPNAGAVDDLIKDNETGFIIDYKNVNSIVEKIEYLFDHPDHAKQIGKNAKQFILQNATAQKSAQGFLDAVKSVGNDC